MADIEEHIRRATQEGKFQDLPGKGKPLNLEENPHENPDWRLANHMLRSSGYTLPWIEARNEIEAETAAARSDLRRAWEWRQAALSSSSVASGEWTYAQVQAEWQRAIQIFISRVERINKRILDFNLQAPSERFQIMKLNVQKEIAEASHVSGPVS